MMNITRLSMENFLSHRDSRINISEKRGLVLIEGINEDGRFDSNGSGKSAILEGLLYGLTGNTLRNVGVNDVVNRNVGKNTEVTISFTTDTGEYQVQRYRKHAVEGNKIKLWDVGPEVMGDISKRLDKETQKKIDEIIDIPYDILINTILLGEGLSSRFTQLSDPDKKALIESTLSLDYDISGCRATANTKLKECKLEESGLTSRIMTLEEFLSQDQEELSRMKSEASYSLSLLPNPDEMDSQIETLNESINLMSNKVITLDKAIAEYDALNSRLNTLDIEVAGYVNEITRILNEPIPHCSLCHQEIRNVALKEEYIGTFKSKADAGTAQMKEWQAQLSSMPDMSLMKTTRETLATKIFEDTKKRDALVRESQEVRMKIIRLQNTISSVDNHIASKEEYATKKTEAERELVHIKKSLGDYEYLYNLFSPTGIVTVILEEAIQYINERIRVYTEILMDKSYELELVKGKIVLRDSTGASYQSLSNGEKRRLDIAIQFSLHDYTCMYCGIGVNILFIDEILDTLDATGVNNIIEVLNMKLEYCKLQCIFVITHNSALKSYFDEVITVHKGKDGNSTII